MPRNAKKLTRFDFPEELIKAMRELDAKGEFQITKISRREALSLRNLFYQLFATLRRNYSLDDEKGVNLDKIARKIVIRVEPTRGAPNTPSSLRLEINPIVRYFQESNNTTIAKN